ncbi:MAG: hypothetical protein C4576_19635 [Desulfobacteraceae bacterium]|nr:MAG: hypothetical protein C4576_19635 [Desulfobacteraceae bacterium]
MLRTGFRIGNFRVKLMDGKGRRIYAESANISVSSKALKHTLLKFVGSCTAHARRADKGYPAVISTV